MLTDIEIAQNAKMKKITEIAAELGISDEFLEPTVTTRPRSQRASIRLWHSVRTES